MIDKFLAFNAATTHDEIETFYDAFNEFCHAQNLSADQKELWVKRLIDVYDQEKLAYKKAYVPLLLTSLLDASKSYDGELISQVLCPFLLQALNGINDYSVRDDQQRFIHFISHFCFLIEALQATNLLNETDQSDIGHTLFNAYLKNESAYFYNEPILAGNSLLLLLSNDAVAKLFKSHDYKNPSSSNDQEMVTQANYQQLWQNMLLISQKNGSKAVDLFDPLMSALMHDMLE